MGWSFYQVQLPAGVPERTWQHHGRCTEPDHYLPQPRHSESVLDGITLGAAKRPECHDPTVVEGDHGVEKEVHVAAGPMLVQMYVTDWAEAQREDSVLSMVLDWFEAQKNTDLKTLLGEHASSEEG